MWYVGGELYHHGIKGQKWGERRYQNPDGTYTEEGKRRYFSDKYGAAYGSKKYKRKMSLDNYNYTKDYKQQMRDRRKNKESKEDVAKRLREKYGDIEYETFEKNRKSRAEGAAILGIIAAALTVSSVVSGVKAYRDVKKMNDYINSTYFGGGNRNMGNNTNQDYDSELGKSLGKGMYAPRNSKPKMSMEDFQKQLKRERQKAATQETLRRYKESDEYKRKQQEQAARRAKEEQEIREAIRNHERRQEEEAERRRKEYWDDIRKYG